MLSPRYPMAHLNTVTSLSSMPDPATWDASSDATPDDFQGPPCCFGVPLTRMVRLESLSSSSSQSSNADNRQDSNESGCFIRDNQINLIEEDMSLFDLALSQRDSDGDLSLRSTSHAYVHHVIDDMARYTRGSSSPRLFMHATPSHPSYPLLIRHLPSTITCARELSLWRYFNDDSLRRDPWNPFPPVLSIVERELPSSAVDPETGETETDLDSSEDEAYIAMDRLYYLQDNPLKSTGDWIDLVRQMLQGLVFMHEHNIARVSYPLGNETLSLGIMMDIGLAPRQTHFSRAEFPVKYYLLDFSTAVRLRVNAAARSSYPQFSSLRGRSRNIALLTASRPRVSSIFSGTCTGDLIEQTTSMKHVLAFPGAQAHPNSEIPLVSSESDTLDSSTTLDTPKQSRFCSRSSSLDRYSDPELESGSEEASDEEQQNIWEVSSTTRALLFAGDLKSLALVLEDAVQPAKPVSEALVPVFSAMRQAKMLSLSAEDALRLFENAVRPLNVANVVT